MSFGAPDQPLEAPDDEFFHREITLVSTVRFYTFFLKNTLFIVSIRLYGGYIPDRATVEEKKVNYIYFSLLYIYIYIYIYIYRDSS